MAGRWFVMNRATRSSLNTFLKVSLSKVGVSIAFFLSWAPLNLYNILVDLLSNTFLRSLGWYRGV